MGVLVVTQSVSRRSLSCRPKAKKAKPARMTQSANINAHAGPAQILQGSFLMEKNVIRRKNVTLILVGPGGLLQLVVWEVVRSLSCRPKAKKAKPARMTQSANINAHAGPAQILQGSFLMEKNVIG